MSALSSRFMLSSELSVVVMRLVSQWRVILVIVVFLVSCSGI